MKYGDLVTQEEMRYAALLRPADYLANSYGPPDFSTLVAVLQNLMHASLSEYLGLAWVYPFLERRSYLSAYHVEGYIVRGLLDARPVLARAESHHGVFGATRGALDKLAAQAVPQERDIAEVYARFYSEFPAVVASLRCSTVMTKPACSEFRLDDYAASAQDFLKPLADLKDETRALQQMVTGFYLHGSLATGDFIPHWSDVDTLVVVRSATLQDVEALVELRHRLVRAFRHFLMVDPLQLHGYFVIGEPDLEFYPQTYFPLVLFGYARSFLPGDGSLEVACRDARCEALQILWDAVKGFLMRANGRAYTFGTHFERKVFMHSIFSFPLYYLQAQGQHLYKRDSFALAQGDFPEDAWQAIELATGIMRDWDHPFRISRWTRGVGEINVKLWMKLLHRLLDSRHSSAIRPFERLDRQAKALVEKMARLAVCAWEAVRRQADACLAQTGMDP